MAILTAAQLDDIRQSYVKDNGVATINRPRLNAAIQAIEDTLTSASVQNAINSAINAAITPATLSAAEKRLLVARVLLSRFTRGNN